MKSESKQPITVEDLLRLKRAERPAPEFWTEFDRQLRAKQLAALVAKRPWWQTLPRFSFLARYRIPLGAAAVVALTALSVRHYQTGAETPIMPASDESAQAVSATVAQNETISNVASGSRIVASEPVVTESHASRSTAVNLIAVSAPTEDAPVTISPNDTLTVDAVSPAAISRALSGGAAVASVDAEPLSPSARHIAANLAAAEFSDSMAGRGLLGVHNGFETRAMPARVAVEPLQQMTSPSDLRRSRILTAMVSTASLETSERTSERAATRMMSDDDRLYDRMQRLGAKADRVNWKF